MATCSLDARGLPKTKLGNRLDGVCKTLIALNLGEYGRFAKLQKEHAKSHRKNGKKYGVYP